MDAALAPLLHQLRRPDSAAPAGHVRRLRQVSVLFLTIVSVKSRLFVNLLNEQFWSFRLPSFQCLNGCLVLQGALRNEVVVGGQVSRPV